MLVFFPVSFAPSTLEGKDGCALRSTDDAHAKAQAIDPTEITLPDLELLDDSCAGNR